MKAVLISLLILFKVTISLAQEAKSTNKFIDSLNLLLEKNKTGVKRIQLLNALSEEYRYFGNPEKSKFYAEKALNYGLKFNSKKISKQNLKTLNLGIGNAYGNIATFYLTSGDFPIALDYYFKALKIDEKFKNKEGEARRLGNIGNLYNVKSDFKKALEYYSKSLKVASEIGDKSRSGVQYGNIGIIYDDMATNANKEKPGSGDSLYVIALDYYHKALEISRHLNIKSNTAVYLGNIGTVYEKQDKKDLALEYYFKALEIAKSINDVAGTSIHFGNIAGIYSEQKEYLKSEQYFSLAIEATRKVGDINTERLIEEMMSEMYTAKKDFENAMVHFKLSAELKSKIFNQEKENEATRKELNYEFEKREAIAKEKQAKEDAIKAADARRQQMVLFFVAGGLILVLVFAVFVVRSLRKSNKQKKMIEVQKHELEEKQKEIIDSITYAGRIQRALLATESKIKKEINRLKQ